MTKDKLAARTVRHDFPRRVREIENLWIELKDGTRLAARVWLPEDAEDDPVPAILEYLPYRKRDGTIWRDQLTHPWFAGYGYAGVRVDMRGNGESDGVMLDEYTRQEHDDCVEVIAWLAAQPWCSGAVGMMGISWGGFNGLQVAALRPPALKAVVTLCSTHDRYADDIHYKGGCMLSENLGWSSTMFCYSSRPPDPALVGNRWMELWQERLAAEPHLVETWLRHQTRDDYWKHGSVCEDWDAIQAPVLAVGGWSDAYSNAVPALLANLKCPRKGIIGPWLHKYPHFAVPGPAIGFLQEAKRWWDRWLKGEATGVEQDPDLRAWINDWAPPQPFYRERQGRFVAERQWPSPEIRPRRLTLNATGLGETAGPESELVLCSPQDTGTAGGEYCMIWLGAEGPTDQRVDDAGSLCFDSAPLGAAVEILGAPVLELELASDRPAAFVCARLNDVAPDGSSLRVTYGLLNLTQREDREHPTPLEPGRRYRVRLRLDDIGHHFRPGHRIRVALSTAYWPMIWPSPEPVTLTVVAGASLLELPVRPLREEAPVVFPPPESAPDLVTEKLRPASNSRRILRDVGSGEVTVEIHDDFGNERIPGHGLESGMWARETWRIKPDDPLAAVGETHWEATMGRGAWQVRTDTRARLTCDRTHFHVEGELCAYEGIAPDERLIVKRSFKQTLRRVLM